MSDGSPPASSRPGSSPTPHRRGSVAAPVPATRGRGRPATPSTLSPAAGHVRGGHTDHPRHREPVPVRPPARTLLTWAALCLLILAAGAGAGYGVSAIQDPVYGAETDILYRVGDSGGAERELATQEVILQGRAVLQPVADEAGLAVAELQKLLSVEAVGQSDVLRVLVAHAEPDVAVDLAHDISQGYVQSVAQELPAAHEEAAEYVADERTEVAEALDAVEARLASLEAADGAAVDPAEEQRLQAEADRLQARLAGLDSLLAGAEAVTRDGAQVRVLTDAYLLEEPLEPRPVRAAVAGGMAAVVVIAALGSVLARRWGYV